MNPHLPGKKTASNLLQQNSSEDEELMNASPEPDQMEENDGSEVNDQVNDQESADEAIAGEAIAGEDGEGSSSCVVCFKKYRRVKRHLMKVCSHFLTSQVQGLR